MTAYQVTHDWDSNRAKHYPATIDREVNYFPYPMEQAKAGGTGIRDLLAEKVFTSCGSGSSCDTAFFHIRKNVKSDNISGSWVVVYIPSGEEVEQVAPPTASEKLTKVRDIFGFSTAALADVIKASRASVYNWIDDDLPNENFVRRIDMLYKLALEWEQKCPYHFAPGRLMKQKLGNGPSMHERLSRDILDLSEIHAGMDDLLALMHKQREKMDRSKAISAKVEKDSDSHSELLEQLTGSISTEK